MPTTSNRRSPSSFKFTRGDKAVLNDLGKYTRVQINKGSTRMSDEPFYEFRYLEGPERYCISHVFEHKLITMDEFDAIQEELRAEN
jgi:hypothetical protein